jgi:hypothetical protein
MMFEEWAAAEAERLLSSDDYGSRIGREAQGQVLWRVRVKVAGENGSCERLWLLVRAGQLLSGATFLKCGAHALLGSLPVRAQWPGSEAAGGRMLVSACPPPH